MKKYIRLIALLLSLVTLLSMFAACADNEGGEVSTSASASVNDPGNSNVTGEDTTKEETLYEEDNLAEKYEFNKTITIFMWSDYRMREFYAEETGNIIDDAIYKRNISVADRLGIEFSFIEAPGDSQDYKSWITQAENDWAADNEYDIYAGYSRTIPLLTLKGMTTNLLSHDDFSVEKPWWPEALTSECTINDKLYFCSGDVATSLLWYMVAMMYNKELYESHLAQLGKTPMDMVQANEWTLDNFLSIVQDIYTDDGNGSKDLNDFYGATLFKTDLDSFQIGAGITSIEKDESGSIRLSEKYNSQRCADICEAVGATLQAEGVLGISDDVRKVFQDSRSIFHMDRVFIIPGSDTGSGGGLEFDVGVVPVPKYDKDQQTYRTNIGNPFTLYAINSMSRDLNESVVTLEALASANYRSVTPAVFEVAMKVRYTDDPQVAEMFDILRDGISFDVGKLYHYTFDGATSKIFRDTASSGNPSGFLTNLSRSQRIIDQKIKLVMAAYSD